MLASSVHAAQSTVMPTIDFLAMANRAGQNKKEFNGMTAKNVATANFPMKSTVCCRLLSS
jgi:hypothetical protein